MSIPLSIRVLVLEREGWRCRYCRHHLEPLGTWTTDLNARAEVDHDIPTARGGTDDLSNLVASCGPCNAQKGGKTAAEYAVWLAWKASVAATPCPRCDAGPHEPCVNLTRRKGRVCSAPHLERRRAVPL